MDEQLGFGFIGAGEVAVASAQAVRDSAHATLVRVFDARSDLAEDLVASYRGRAAQSIEELLADPSVGAVYICVPHYLHRDLALSAAGAGKHVLVEKPMGVTPEDARAIVDACHTAGVACGVPFVARHAPAYQVAHELVRSGAIGDVTGFRITFRDDKTPSYWSSGLTGRVTSDWRQSLAQSGGGVLLMNAVHDLDAILWITGLEVENVQGVTANIGSPGEVEDVGLAILICAGGALGSVEARSSAPGGPGPGDRWANRVYGSRGQIVLPSPWETGPPALFARDEGAWREIALEPMGDPRRLAFEGFAAAVLAGTAVPIPGEDGLMASRLIHAVYESARRGERVAV